jgi:hypothetical protein
VTMVPVATELSPTRDHDVEPLEGPLMNIIRNRANGRFRIVDAFPFDWLVFSLSNGKRHQREVIEIV